MHWSARSVTAGNSELDHIASKQVFAAVMTEFDTSRLRRPRDAGCIEITIADELKAITYAPPVMAVPAIEGVTVASAVERTLPSMLPISLTEPLKGARITALPAARLAAEVVT